MSNRTEWVVPTSYGTEISIPAPGEIDIPLIDNVQAFNVYAVDQLTVVTVVGHIVPAESSTTRTTVGWRIRMGLENLQLGTLDNSGTIAGGITAEEHFLDERWWNHPPDTADEPLVHPYYLTIKTSSKRSVRLGQALMFTMRQESVNVRRFRIYLRVLISIKT